MKNAMTQNRYARRFAMPVAYAIIAWLVGSISLCQAADPKDLREALLNYTWEWTHAPKPPDKLKFSKDGTASCPRFTWNWKITGPRTAIASNGKGWEAELKFDATFRSLVGDSKDGKYHYTAVRLK